MRTLPDKSFDVIMADPPYNIGKAEWDKWPTVEAYVADVMTWLREFSRLLKDTGSLWMFHSDMAQFSRILAQSQHEPGLILRDFVVVFKRNFAPNRGARPSAPLTPDCAACLTSMSILRTGLPARAMGRATRPGLSASTQTPAVLSPLRSGTPRSARRWG